MKALELSIEFVRSAKQTYPAGGEMVHDCSLGRRGEEEVHFWGTRSRDIIRFLERPGIPQIKLSVWCILSTLQAGELRPKKREGL